MDIYRTTEHGVACAAAGLFVSKIGFNRQCIYSARCLVSNSTESHGYMYIYVVASSQEVDSVH